MPNLITSKYPPVNGNICEKFVAIDKECMPCRFEWSDEYNSFVVAETKIDTSYSKLEKFYEVFIWQPEQ